MLRLTILSKIHVSILSTLYHTWIGDYAYFILPSSVMKEQMTLHPLLDVNKTLKNALTTNYGCVNCIIVFTLMSTAKRAIKEPFWNGFENALICMLPVSVFLFLVLVCENESHCSYSHNWRTQKYWCRAEQDRTAQFKFKCLPDKSSLRPFKSIIKVYSIVGLLFILNYFGLLASKSVLISRSL